jgi:Co/Zn/Cd efflux system component
MRNRSPKRASELEADPVEHYTRLADDFGYSRHYRSRDDGRQHNSRRLMLEPLSLFIFAVLALLAVIATQMWQWGVFDPIFGSKSAVVDTSSKRWQLNGRAARVADDRVVEVDEPDVSPDEDGTAAE